MSKRFRLSLFGFLALSVLSLSIHSCKKEAATGWDTEMLLPLATSSLSLTNLVKDSSIKVTSDNSLTLAYNSTLYEFNLADQIINIPDTSIGQKFNLSNLNLPNQRFDYRVSLGFLARTMLQSPDGATQFIGQFILAQNGNTTAIPALNNFSPGSFQFDASAFFDSAVLATGQAQIWAINRLPVPVTDITLEMRNTDDQSLIATKYIPFIPSNDSVYVIIPLAGKKVKNQLDINFVSMNTPGSSGAPVLVDTTNFIQMRMFITSMTAQEAWAKFPTQNVIDITEEVTQDIGDRKFTYVDARQGELHVFVTSSVEEQLYLEYTLVGAYDKNGQPIVQYTVVPPAPSGGTSTIDRIIDISGSSINLTGKDGSKFNTYTQRVVARIDSSGITRYITAADSLIVRYEINNIAPNYIKGYAGRDTIVQTGTSAFGFLDMFKSGTLDLEDVNMNFTIENGIGVDGAIKINNLTAISNTNGTKTLTGSIVGQPLSVNRATDFPLTKATTNFAVNKNNSNIKELISLLPNQIQYDVEVKTNLTGNNQTYNDFAYLESNLKVGLNAEIPLSLIANSLLLMDTIDFDLSQTNTNINGISDGIINIIAQNKYPIDARATVIIIDENWAVVDTLASNQIIAAADLNNSCKTDQAKRSKISVYVDEDRLTNIKRGKKAIIVADFSTASGNPSCNGQYIKIYNDYKLDFTFTAKFNYKLNAKF